MLITSIHISNILADLTRKQHVRIHLGYTHRKQSTKAGIQKKIQACGHNGSTHTNLASNTQYSQPQTYQYFFSPKTCLHNILMVPQFVWALKICSSRAVEVGNYSEVPRRLLFRGKVIYQSLSDFGRHVRLCQMAFRILRTALLIVLGRPHT